MTSQPKPSEPEKNPHNVYLMKISPEQEAASEIAFGLADEAMFYDAGLPGMTAEQLHKRYWDAYMLGRNALDHAFGVANPYAEDRIDAIRAGQQEPPQE